MARAGSLAFLGATLLATSPVHAQSFDGQWHGTGTCRNLSGGYTIDLTVQGTSIAGAAKAFGIKAGYGASEFSFRGHVDLSGTVTMNEASSGANKFSGQVSGRRMTFQGWTGSKTCEYALELVGQPKIAAAPPSPQPAPAHTVEVKPSPTPTAPAVVPPVSVAKPSSVETTRPTAPPNPERDAFVQRNAPELLTVQRQLAVLGFYRGNPDGAYGPGTAGAIDAWQRSQNLPSTGFLTVVEMDRLKQQALAQLGGPAAPPTGPQSAVPDPNLAKNDPPSPTPPVPAIKDIEIPVVACPIDGQMGRQKPEAAPTAIRRALPEKLAPRLAAYRGLQGSPDLLVLAPRGWRCMGLYGSNGDTAFIVPPSVNPGQEARFQGPVVEVRVRYGGTSGRTSVASTAGPLFKIAGSFIDDLEANFPSQDKYRRSPWPNETVSQVSDRLITYVDPPMTEGTGTQGKLAAGSKPIHGVVVFTEESDLVVLAGRLEPGDTELLPLVISDFQAVVLASKRPTASSQPPSPQPAIPPTNPASQASDPTLPSPKNEAPGVKRFEWAQILGGWVPRRTFKVDFCSKTSPYPPPPDYIRIGPSSVTLYEGGCDITGMSRVSETSIGVSMKCGDFNDRSVAKTQAFSLANGLLVVDGTPYMRCSRPE